MRDQPDPSPGRAFLRAENEMPMQLTRDSVATLLRLAQTAENPAGGGAGHKAADLKDDLENQSTRDMTCRAQDVQSAASSWR